MSKFAVMILCVIIAISLVGVGVLALPALPILGYIIIGCSIPMFWIAYFYVHNEK